MQLVQDDEQIQSISVIVCIVIIFRTLMNILFIIKVEILVLLKRSYRCLSIMLTVVSIF